MLLIYHLQHYDCVTTGRQLITQWKKVSLLANEPHEQIRAILPEPFGAVKYKKEGKILGKQIDMGAKPLKAIYGRLYKAKTAWGGVLEKRSLLREGLKPRIRIQLWAALIRSTLTYALQTQNIESPKKPLRP